MNDPCPFCGLPFLREEGGFTGAMYVSYPLSMAILIPLYFALGALLPNLNNYLVLLVATILYLPFVGVVFRYSRVVWIHFDQRVDPHGRGSGSAARVRHGESKEPPS
jgi:hypothetical protein